MVDLGDIGQTIDEGVEQAQETAEDVAESEPVQEAIEAAEEKQRRQEAQETVERMTGRDAGLGQNVDIREGDTSDQQQQDTTPDRPTNLSKAPVEQRQDTQDTTQTQPRQQSRKTGPSLDAGTPSPDPEPQPRQQSRKVGPSIDAGTTTPDTGEQQPDQPRTGQTGGPIAGTEAWEQEFDTDGPGLDDLATGAVDEATDLGSRAAENVTPSATLSLDPEGLGIREAREREFAERAESGFEDITSGRLPSGREVGAAVFQAGEITERGIVGTGQAAGDVIDAGVDLTQFGATAATDPREGVQRLEQAEQAFDEGGLGPTFETLSGGGGPSIGGEQAGEIPGNIAEGALAGLGMGIGAGIRAPTTVAADLTGDVPAGETQTPSEATGAFGQVEQLGQSQVEMFEERPVSTAALFALPALEGTAAGVRGFRSTRGARETVKLSEITSERGVQGDLPQFRTDPNAPTSRAVTEVRTRAAESPDVIQELTGSEQVLFHSTPERLPTEFRAKAGQSELPGLFTSPDASPLRLENVRGASESVSLRERLTPSRPDLSTQPDRLAAFEGSRIEGMPEWAKGSGRIKEGGQFRPDPTTSGARFLREQADPGTAQVRPRGARTTELEAIFPPESQFRQSGRVAVETPSGEKIPTDIFRTERGTRTGEVSGTRTATEIARSTTTRPSTTTTGPSLFGFGPTGMTPPTPEPTSGADGGTTTEQTTTPTEAGQSPFDFSGIGERTFSDIQESVGDFTTQFDGVRRQAEPTETGPTETTGPDRTQPEPTDTGTRPEPRDPFRPTEPPERTPTEPPTEPPTRTPTEPPSQPPSQPPSSPPSGPPTGVPSAPPSGQPGYPFGTSAAQPPTNRLPRRADDDDDRDEEELPEIGPAGQEFQNPVASGSAFLFGPGLGSASGQQSLAENVLPGGPGTPSEGVLSGVVEPPELFEGVFINDN